MSASVVGGLFALLAVVIGARLTAGEYRARLRKAILEDVQLRDSASGTTAAELELKIERQMRRYLTPADPNAIGIGFWSLILTGSVAVFAAAQFLDFAWWVGLLIGCVTGGVLAYVDILRISSANRRHGLE